MNHRWENNVCKNCGLHRVKRGWKLLMAISNTPPYNHYQYGNSWFYGEQHPESKILIKSLGFERPDCKKV